MVHDSKRAKDLEAVREALTYWRRHHGGRGRPIPESLWSRAADVARVSGVAETARALRLDATRLAKRVEGGTELAPRRIDEPTTFVEVGGLELGAPRRVAVVELVGREGDRVRVEVGAGSAVDLVALARAFWGRA
ncbi:MAG: hypothetical protein JOZ35_07305 [Hyphomicrobiales bacterium]|nr:hypothetical protein [Hyphomicrobiales bacterium]MBV8239862.1 hypothetical protein [Hyphomicrobiales bacterium]MBV8286711.1 hypothetical protein [Hyphomicrobiales bacterium]MBV8420561.1 hypothetical protein [Hyphomicrobiales bacterium]